MTGGIGISIRELKPQLQHVISTIPPLTIFNETDFLSNLHLVTFSTFSSKSFFMFLAMFTMGVCMSVMPSWR